MSKKIVLYFLKIAELAEPANSIELSPSTFLSYSRQCLNWHLHTHSSQNKRARIVQSHPNRISPMRPNLSDEMHGVQSSVDESPLLSKAIGLDESPLLSKRMGLVHGVQSRDEKKLGVLSF